MLDKLQKYAMIVGVVSAIGGGFYAWGVFNNSLDAVSEAVGSDTIEKLQQQVNLLDKRVEVLDAKLDEFRSGLNNPLGR